MTIEQFKSKLFDLFRGILERTNTHPDIVLVSIPFYDSIKDDIISNEIPPAEMIRYQQYGILSRNTFENIIEMQFFGLELKPHELVPEGYCVILDTKSINKDPTNLGDFFLVKL